MNELNHKRTSESQKTAPAHRSDT